MFRAAFAAALVLVASDAWAADAACPFGVNAHQASSAALDQAAAAGIAWVRFDMNWLQFEPAKGSYDWTIADDFVAHASSLGLNVYVTIAYTPSWAVGAACNDADPEPLNWCHNAPPANVSDWTDFVTAAVQRYGTTVKAWGMWNEPNLKSFYRGSRDQYVSDILVPGSQAVHAACSGCLVGGPELANLRGADWDANEGTCIGNNCLFNGWNYSLKKVLEVAAGSIDVVTHHKYADPADDLWKSAVDGSYEIVKVTDGVKEITDALAPGKPVWITEGGWHSEPFGDVTNAYAAEQLTALYTGMTELRAGTFAGADNQPWPELEKVFWYDLSDDPGGYSWGLLDSELAPKDPYDAYAAVVPVLGCGGGEGGGGASASGAQSGSGGGMETAASSVAVTGSGVGSGAGGAAAGSEALESSSSCALGRRANGAAPLVWLLLLGLARRRRADNQRLRLVSRL